MTDRFAVAERKGREAFEAGLQESDCPYDDKRKPNGKLSWSRAWRNAWLMGFQLAKFDAKQTERGEK